MTDDYSNQTDENNDSGGARQAKEPISNMVFGLAVLVLATVILGGTYFYMGTGAQGGLGTGAANSLRIAAGSLDRSGNRAQKSIIFGFALRGSPDEDARQYLPFLAYLERATGLSFRLRFTPRDGNIVADLGSGIVQLAAVGSVSYLKADRAHDVIPLARGLNKSNRAEYQSVIVVHPESPINSLTELKGARFAFGSNSSTQGYVIPLMILKDSGITLGNFASAKFTGSHHNCAQAVISKNADACGMQDTMGQGLAAKQFVRIIHTSNFFPSSGIIASAELPAEIREKVRAALVEFEPKGKHAAGLYKWGSTEMPNGFVAATPADYKDMERRMLALDLL